MNYTKIDMNGFSIYLSNNIRENLKIIVSSSFVGNVLDNTCVVVSNNLLDINSVIGQVINYLHGRGIQSIDSSYQMMSHDDPILTFWNNNLVTKSENGVIKTYICRKGDDKEKGYYLDGVQLKDFYIEFQKLMQNDEFKKKASLSKFDDVANSVLDFLSNQEGKRKYDINSFQTNVVSSRTSYVSNSDNLNLQNGDLLNKDVNYQEARKKALIKNNFHSNGLISFFEIIFILLLVFFICLVMVLR